MTNNNEHLEHIKLLSRLCLGHITEFKPVTNSKFGVQMLKQRHLTFINDEGVSITVIGWSEQDAWNKLYCWHVIHDNKF